MATAIDHKQKQSFTALDSERIALSHDWTIDPRTATWSDELKRLGKGRFELAADRRVDPEKRAFWRWLNAQQREVPSDA